MVGAKTEEGEVCSRLEAAKTRKIRRAKTDEDCLQMGGAKTEEGEVCS